MASKDLSTYYLLFNGDFAYNKSYSNDYPWGTVKRLNDFDKGVVSSLYICFKPYKVNSDFLECYFETDKWHKEVSNIAGEGARNHGLLNISTNDFFHTKIFIPSLEEQISISRFIKEINDRILTQNKIIDALKSLKSRIKANVVGTLKLFDIAVCQSSTLALRDVRETGLYPVFGANGLCGYSDHYQFDSPGVAIIKDGAGVGRTFVITGGRYSILGTLNLLQPKDVSVNFLDLCLNGIDFRKYIVGSGIPHIYFEDYKVEKVPELNGDNELLSKLASAIEERIGIDTEVLNLFSKQKEYLLKNMFI